MKVFKYNAELLLPQLFIVKLLQIPLHFDWITRAKGTKSNLKIKTQKILPIVIEHSTVVAAW